MRRAIQLVTLVLLALFLAACEGGVSGGEQTVFSDPLVAGGAVFRVNSDTGSDSDDGIDQPFATLQHALDQLRAGDTLILEQGTVYSSTARIGETLDGRELQGFVLRNSGAPGAPITIEGEAGTPPIIDQLQTGSSAADPAVLGIYLDCASHVVIRNLHIIRANEAGISSSMDGVCETTDIVVEGNSIRDIYGEKYVGGIRMMGVSDLVVRNNQIESVFSNAMAVENRSMFLNGLGVENILIENNQFDHLAVGVAVNAQGLGDPLIAEDQRESVVGLQVADNFFAGDVGSAITMQTHMLDDAVVTRLQSGVFTDVDIYGNIFERVGSVLVAAFTDDEYQSDSLCLFNNTIVAAESTAVDLTAAKGFEFFNNIVLMPQADILLTRSPSNPALINQFNYSDNNLFLSADTKTWQLDIGGVNPVAYADLGSWQAAIARPELSALVNQPDSSPVLADPQFIDSDNADYRLSAASPALLAGRFGMSIGADFDLPPQASQIDNACIERIF